MKKGLLLDLDGVVVDFVRGVIAWYASDAKYSDITWNLEKIVAPTLTPSVFWDNLGYDFWLSLPFTPFGRELVESLIKMVGAENICICTSPCRTPGGVEAKIRWIEQNLPQLKRNFMVTPKKDFAASPNRILIDDNNENCLNFRQAGGYTVLIPQPWNDRAGMLNDDYSFNMGSILEEIEDKLSLE